MNHTYESNDIDFTLAYIINHSGWLKLKVDSFKIKDNNYLEVNLTKRFEIMNSKINVRGSFESNKDHFYFLTYSDNDFSCGYYDSSDNIDPNIQEISVNKNEESPLEFFDVFKIEYVKFINNYKYAYYKINNLENNKTYYGIIDIKKNIVVFNTDEEIITYVPYSDISMLAITSSTAYEICVK